MLVPFGTEAYQHSSLPLSAQNVVNTYIEAAPPNAKTPAAVVAAFGIKYFTEMEFGKMRGGIVVNDTIFCVCGTGLYQVNPLTGAGYYLGSIPGQAPVFMAGDGHTVFITADGPAYLWDGTPGLLIGPPGTTSAGLPVINPGPVITPVPPVVTSQLLAEDGSHLLTESGTPLAY